MITVLMVDDDTDLVETVREHLTGAGSAIRFESETDFKKAPDRIKEVRPDVVILDWFHGTPATGEESGKEVWKKIWQAWFCPVVLYSAGDVDIAEEVPEDHPFVKTVEKGGESLATVAGHLESFQSHVGALREVANDLDRVKHDILRDLAAVVFTSVGTPEERLETLKRSARRRIAAVMDDHHHISAERALPWEQYIYPVLTNHPIMGDLIRLSDQPETNREAYRVILSPTCDMVSYGGKPCKISHFLAAKCHDPKRFLSEGLQVGKKAKKSDVLDNLKSALNEAHKGGLIILPGCAGFIPLMVLDLKDLELIPATDVASGSEKSKKYQRVASIDSPFREFIGWGYMQVGCRPGVPPRDSKVLAAELAALWEYVAEPK